MSNTTEPWRWLAIGDPHFKISNVKDAREFRAKVVKLIHGLKQKPDAVVILGDLHDAFERVHSLVMAEICGLFQDILDCWTDDTYLYYIVGNHDYINNQAYLTGDHAFLPFKKWDRLRIVDKPGTVYTESYGTFVVCPYVPPGRLGEALATMEYDFMKARAVFCHQEFRDVQLGPRPSKHGDAWPADAPLAISGHIHEQQWLKENIFYVGEPFDSSYGSEGQKTVSIIDFYEEGKPVINQVDLGMPRRLTVTLTIDQLKAFQKPENAHVRVYVTGTTEELAVFKKSKEYKELSKEVKIITKPSDVLIARRNEGGLRYAEILAQSVANESEAVKEAFLEIQGT